MIGRVSVVVLYSERRRRRKRLIFNPTNQKITNYGLKRLKGSIHDSECTYSVCVVIVIIG